MRKALEVTTGRHPFQVAVVVACPLAAVAILIASREPRSLDNTLPSGFVTVWLVAIALNGLIALFGIYWRHPLGWGLMVECGGVLGLGAMITVYCAAIAVTNGLDALASGGLITGIAVACWWRGAQIIRDLRLLHRAQQQPVIEQRELLMEPDPPTPDPS